MTTQPQTITQYIAGFPHDVQAVLKKVRATIRKAAPDAEEAIKYKIAAYVQDGKNLVFFAGYARHLGVYPLPTKRSKQLAKYATAKGTARFPLDEPIPYPLIAETVEALLRELRPAPKKRAKAAAKPAKIPGSELPILPFAKPADWQRWLERQHTSARGVWMKLAKKGSGIASIDRTQAVDAALCYGWIDGQGRSFDADYYVIKFTPRSPRSVWSKINRSKVAALIEQGLMKPAGLAEVERAQRDGRLDAAYDSPRTASVPDDLEAALKASPRARSLFAELSAANRYAILWQLQTAKQPETRARRIGRFVTMLERGETLH